VSNYTIDTLRIIRNSWPPNWPPCWPSQTAAARNAPVHHNYMRVCLRPKYEICCWCL